MIECGRVRWPLTRIRPIGFSSFGTSPTGIHHASRMLASIAPAFIDIIRPSPVEVSIDTGSVIGPRRNVRTSVRFHSIGASPTGIHHASRMLESIAPARRAMSRPSPVEVSIDTGCVIGPRRNARRSSSFHSNPPQARITPFVAPTSIGPSAVSTMTPTTAPPSRMSRCPRHDVRGSIPRSRHARSNRPVSA